MAYTSTLGLPKILIDFQSSASTAMIRSSRGVVATILNDSSVTDDTAPLYFSVKDAGDIPATIDDSNADLLKKCLLGTPAEIHAFLIPNAYYETETAIVTEEIVESEVTVQSEVEVFIVGVEDIDNPELSTEDSTETVISDVTVMSEVTVTDTAIITVMTEASITQAAALDEISALQFNWICHPTGTAQDQSDLAAWIKLQRKNNNKKFKAVVSHVEADSEGVVNFTTEKIRVVNPAYTEALAEVGGDAELVDSDIAKYITYTSTEYTARIMGALAGIGLDRSATYFQLPEIVDCARYENIDDHINRGELCLIDERDGNGVKIARGCNSLTTFTAQRGESLRHIKVVESCDFIAQDIESTFKKDYVGKVLNSYENKMLFISAILVYLKQLEGTVLDNSSTAENYVELDLQAHREWAALHNIAVDEYSEQQLRELNTGVNVFLTGRIFPLNAMEDLELHFTLA